MASQYAFTQNTNQLQKYADWNGVCSDAFMLVDLTGTIIGRSDDQTQSAINSTINSALTTALASASATMQDFTETKILVRTMVSTSSYNVPVIWQLENSNWIPINLKALDSEIVDLFS